MLRMDYFPSFFEVKSRRKIALLKEHTVKCPRVVALVLLALWSDASFVASNPVCFAKSADFYVSPLGSDQWSGTLPGPKADGSDGPVATFERVQKLVRELRTAEPELKRPLVISLRGGLYELATTLQFSAADSGSVASPTRYEAYKKETPVLSGGRII